MKNKREKLRTRFEPDVRFDVAPAPFRATETTALEYLKNRLLRQLLAGAPNPLRNTALRRAANDAAAVAWLTPFPLLVFPELLGEKARLAELQLRRQADVRARSLNLNYLEQAA
jgi:hypothetical protein